MVNSISSVNSYYSMYRYGSVYGNSPVGRVNAVPPINRVSGVAAGQTEIPAAGAAVKSAAATGSVTGAVQGSAVQAVRDAGSHVFGSRPPVFTGGRLYLTFPAEGALAGEGAPVSGSMQAGISPEELAVRMRIQYSDPALAASDSRAASGATAASGNSIPLPGQSGQVEGVSGKEGVAKTGGSEECQTCKQRKYQDGSNDMGVSFKTPTHIAPETAASAVRGHEQEHVSRERAKAAREDRRVVSQSVMLHTAICPECGKSYISGGVTRTVTAAKPETPEGASVSGEKPFLAVA